MTGSSGRPATSANWLGERFRAAAAALPAELRAGELPASAFPLLAGYVDRLLEWGARINLTGARDVETLVEEQLIDALPVVSQLPAGAFDAIDVGSGAGLPGAVLAALRPDSQWTLLEPNQKKAAFLAQIRRDFEAQALPLQTVHTRLEDHVEAGSRYDLAISRAVWPAAEWLERGRALVRSGGRLIALRTDLGEAPPPGAEEMCVRMAGRARSILRVDV